MWLNQPRNPDAPLAGLKVLELARVLAGPWTGQILADLGADVIKVESPDGDGTRRWGPPWVERANGDREAAYYHACNRGKRGVVADFGDAGQLARVKALAANADVVIENFKLGTLARFGLDYASLRADNPGLVYCSITGFGQDGPRAAEPGYDFVIQGMSGLMALTGEPEGAPMKAGVSISDLACGLYAANAVQAALLMRARTGPNQGMGQHIDMALLDCSVALLANQALSYLTTGENPPRMGNAHAQVSAYGVFPVQDGKVILAPANDGLFRKLLTLLDREDLLAEERFATNEGRLANRGELDGIIAGETGKWDMAALLARCAEAGIPAGPINLLEQTFADPQVTARGMQVNLGGIPTVRSPIVFSDAELALDRASPTLGEDQAAFES
ncbi:CaiB/BaiF CoA transferase family protein [Qipengyuania marisflavi]|uniref:CoA transferase n=1 Tax=Qipengyuania marisflavi TaxID=2486356 RepID=A0A5S3P1H2_9SPHN|nr:CaiB/BaiF CoA-transferase family protein [Qipengyuania marisflavi]TMM46608.1 CoA transferase [Qipengyuania marisflavi]